MRRFVLVRTEDVTGVSGIGVVAEGIEFTDGIVVLKWIVGEFHSIVTWVQGIHAVEEIHGHDGRTTVEWLDQKPYQMDRLQAFCISCGHHQSSHLSDTGSCVVVSILGKVRCTCQAYRIAVPR